MKIDIAMINLIPYLSVMFFAACTSKPFIRQDNTIGYNFNRPAIVHILPDTLREISGLTEIDNSTFACIQDENGILFIYDAIENEIKKQYFFHIDGDYEGITRVGNTIYVLQSDGMLFEIINFDRSDYSISSYVTGIPANNNEGLCYDRENNRLLIACKGKLGKGPEYKDKRVIYAIDLKTKMLSFEPVYEFNLDNIRQFALDNDIKLPYRKKKKGAIIEPVIKFRTSAIAVHPVTNKLYLLSAADYLLFVFDKNGNIEHIEQLNPVKFNKAEGITFFSNGNLLITNEGQDKKPTLLLFKYTPV